MRLGEGTGAALAVPIVRAAVAAFTRMATFESASFFSATVMCPLAASMAFNFSTFPFPFVADAKGVGALLALQRTRAEFSSLSSAVSWPWNFC